MYRQAVCLGAGDGPRGPCLPYHRRPPRLREGLSEGFSGRTELPTTLIFADEDSHAGGTVTLVREKYGRGSRFSQQIACRTGFIRVKHPDGTETLEDQQHDVR